MIYKILPKETALLVIDVQMEYFDNSRPLYIPEAKVALENINQIVSTAKNNGIKIIYIRHEHRQNGSDVGRMNDFGSEEVFVEGTPFVELHPNLRIEPSDIVVTKRRYSAFEGTELDQLLKGNFINTVVIVGFMTQFCCVSTARTAHDRDYRSLILSDATAGPDLPDVGFGMFTGQQIQAGTLTSLANGIAEVIKTEEFINRIRSSK